MVKKENIAEDEAAKLVDSVGDMGEKEARPNYLDKWKKTPLKEGNSGEVPQNVVEIPEDKGDVLDSTAKLDDDKMNDGDVVKLR